MSIDKYNNKNRNKYSTEVAKDILDKFHQKGWNVYCNDDVDYVGPNNVIINNLAESLNVNSKYVLLPKADNPRDPNKVMEALEVLAVKLNREMPTITIANYTQPIVGFTLRPNNVYIHTPEGTITSYKLFKESLDSIVQVK